MLLTGLAVPLIAASARPSAEGPLPGHTGGFGEPTCTECHMGSGDDGGASVVVEGLPAAWIPGTAYRLVIAVTAPELRRGGFQLAARFAADGTQAGTLEVADGRGRTTMPEPDGVQYAHHLYDGTAPTAAGVARWTIVWTAPAQGTGAVAFHVAANAANDDNSEFGDRIVTAAATVPAK